MLILFLLRKNNNYQEDLLRRDKSSLRLFYLMLLKSLQDFNKQGIKKAFLCF